jgi:adenine specific DNA methylase Mod
VPYFSSSEINPQLERERAQNGRRHGRGDGGDAIPRSRSGGGRWSEEIRPDGLTAPRRKKDHEQISYWGKMRRQNFLPVPNPIMWEKRSGLMYRSQGRYIRSQQMRPTDIFGQKLTDLDLKDPGGSTGRTDRNFR